MKLGFTSAFTLIILALLLASIICSEVVEARAIDGKTNNVTRPSLVTTKLSNAKAMLTINSFEKGGSGGGPAECDGRYHSDDTLIVALSTPWYANGQRCSQFITIVAPNGNSVSAKVVDECDVKHDGCKSNIVDGSRAVWKGLGVPQKQWGLMSVTWSDA